MFILKLLGLFRRPKLLFFVGSPESKCPRLIGVGEASVVLKKNKRYPLALAAKDGEGKPTPVKVDGKPVWKTSHETVVGLEVAEDGLSAVAVASSLSGNCQITVEVDADLGEGVVPVVGYLDCTIVDEAVAVLEIVPGEPE